MNILLRFKIGFFNFIEEGSHTTGGMSFRFGQVLYSTGRAYQSNLGTIQNRYNGSSPISLGVYLILR